MDKSKKPEPPFHREMIFEYEVPEQVAPGLRRIVCRNPNAFTFKGTNTYLVGEGRVAIVDPGPANQEHLNAILQALAANGERASHIVMTHTHSDHSGNAAALQKATGALLCGKPRTKGEGFQAQAGGKGPSGSTFLAPVYYDVVLDGGSVIEGEGWRLEALFTPGHAPDHLCFFMPEANLLLSGDHVMGWNTSIVAPPEGHMGSYIRSLEMLLARSETRYFPAHGGPVDEPQRFVKALIMHRRWRESEIAEALREGRTNIALIVPKIYGQLESALAGAAALSIFAQIELMIEKGLVATRKPGPPSLDQEYALAVE